MPLHHLLDITKIRSYNISRLSTASETYYYHVLTKKKDTEPPESLLAAVAVSVDAKDSVKASVVKPIVKQLPIETLGLVMCTHGEQFGEDSAFGKFTTFAVLLSID